MGYLAATLSEPRIHFETLANGLTLLLREAHAAPVASFQIWTRVGSADERAHEAGLAHFHEHMLFKGTERRGVGEIAGEVEGVGGQINAYTSFDATVYYATLPSDALASGLDVLVDAVRHSTFDEQEIDREIGVVLEEIHRSNDTPAHVISDAVFAEAYHVHPYRAPILGSEESVASITRERLLDFFARWYAPDQFVVVATGDFDADDLAAQVSAAFADAVPSGVRRERPAEPPQNGLRAVCLDRDFERTSLDLSWKTTALSHPDTPYLDLLAFVLGEGDSSRLVQHVKERDGLADRIDASSYTPLETGLFSVTVDLDPDRVLPCLEAVSREVERLRCEPPSRDELEKARSNFLAGTHFERESVGGMAGKLGGFHVLGRDYRLEHTYLQAIRDATTEDLQRVAERYLGSEKLTAGVLRGSAEGPPLREKQVRQAVESGARRASRSLAARATGTRGEIVSFELGCGARLHVAPSHDVPVVAVRGALRGGLLAETAATAGLGQFTTEMWLRGTRARSSADLARSIEALAADIDGFSGRNSLGLTLDATRDRLGAALDLYAEILLSPAFDPGEIERQRRDTLAAITRRGDRLATCAFDLFQAALYGEHPYGMPVIGSESAVAGFDRRALLEHHGRLVRGPNLVLGVAGDVDPEDVAHGLSRRLAELSDEAAPPPEPPLGPAPREPRDVEACKPREQAHLVVGFQGLTLFDPDRFALELISQLLAGQGGRMFLELRDRRSLAYTVSATNVEGIVPGYFATYIATSPERLDEARQGTLDELRGLLEGLPAEDELERARRYLVGSHAIEAQRSGARALHLSLDALYGLGPDASAHYAEQIRAVTPEDVLRVARRVLDPTTTITATIHP